MEGVQHVPLTQEKAVQLVKDVFISAAERDVYTGDALRICIVTKEGIKEQTMPLRKDWEGQYLPFCTFQIHCLFGSLTSRFLKQECWSRLHSYDFCAFHIYFLQFYKPWLLGGTVWFWISAPVLRSKFFALLCLDSSSIWIFHYVLQWIIIWYYFYILNKCKEPKSLYFFVHWVWSHTDIKCVYTVAVHYALISKKIIWN